jgi:hypothetical protein
MIPTHEIVRRAYPRPEPGERERVAMAVGKALDSAVAQFGHELRQGRRPTQAAIAREAHVALADALAEAMAEVPAEEQAALERTVQEFLRAYRQSEIAGLPRPRTRVVLIGGEVGVYAQPDFWDGRHRFFELKSYRAIPAPPDVALQVRFFQLAFPGFEAVLFCLDRHTSPVQVSSLVVPPPTAAEAREALHLALEAGRESGQEKVLEYVEGPFVRYGLDGGPG